MIDDKLGFAVIGCGKMGKRRIESILRNPNSELICISDIDKKAAKVIAQETGCEYCNDFEKAVSHDEVDWVVVATPNKFHTSVSIAALENGKHVFCEKPLARNPKEAFMMVESALDNKVILKTGSNLRYFPSVLKAKELLDNDTIGETLFLRGWIGNEGCHLKDSWFSDPEMIGGGTFLDNGCHLLDLTRWFLGEVKECMGFVATTYWPSNPLEDNGFGIFKTLDGKLASIHSSWTEWAGYMYFELYGTEGYIHIENRNQICRTTVGDKEGGRHIFDYSLLPSSSYQLEFQDFIKAFLERRQPLPSGYDGLRAVQMAYGVYESSKTRRMVKIYGEKEERLAKLIHKCEA